LKTLSISFRGRSFDETEYIRKVAARYGTEHYELDLNPGENLEGPVEEFAYYNDEPDADAGALPLWFLSKLSKTQVTVTLSGEGGDEIFGGYLTYRANYYARRMRRLPSAAIRPMLALARQWPVSDDKISLEYMTKRFLEGCLLPADRAHVYWNGTFSEDQKDALLCAKPPGTFHRILGSLVEQSRASDEISPYLWFDQKYYLPDDILMKVDRMSMAHAVEARPPFLDHRIVEFMNALPDSFKMRGPRLKVLLKELMKDKLPAMVLRRKKAGLDIPAHEWLRGPLRGLLLDAVKFGTSEHGELFRKSAIDACVRDHLQRRVNLGYHLWGLMILFLWMRKWKIQTAQLPEPEHKAAGSVLTFT
jgi:asparagine synthase (glutamine-hydrolysing)